jgi:hypothetical protein
MAIPSRCARGTNCSLSAVVIVFRDRAHRHRPGFDPGAGVVDIVRGADLEEVAFACFAHKQRLGLGGIRQPGGPGAADAHFVLHVVVAQAGLAILPAPCRDGAPGVRHRCPSQETRKWSGAAGGTAMVTVGKMVSLKRVKGCVV